MAKKKYWNIIKLLLKLGFTTLLGYLVFQKIDYQQVKSVFLNSSPGYIVAAFLSYFASQCNTRRRLRLSRRIQRFIFSRPRHFLRGGHTQNFFYRGQAQADDPPAVFRQRAHSTFVRRIADLIGRSVFQNQLADLVVGVHPLENRVPAVEPGIAAFAAAHGPVNRGVAGNAYLRFQRLRRR